MILLPCFVILSNLQPQDTSFRRIEVPAICVNVWGHYGSSTALIGCGEFGQESFMLYKGPSSLTKINFGMDEFQGVTSSDTYAKARFTDFDGASKTFGVRNQGWFTIGRYQVSGRFVAIQRNILDQEKQHVVALPGRVECANLINLPGRGETLAVGYRAGTEQRLEAINPDGSRTVLYKCEALETVVSGVCYVGVTRRLWILVEKRESCEARSRVLQGSRFGPAVVEHVWKKRAVASASATDPFVVWPRSSLCSLRNGDVLVAADGELWIRERSDSSSSHAVRDESALLDLGWDRLLGEYLKRWQ